MEWSRFQSRIKLWEGAIRYCQLAARITPDVGDLIGVPMVMKIQKTISDSKALWQIEAPTLID